MAEEFEKSATKLLYTKKYWLQFAWVKPPFYCVWLFYQQPEKKKTERQKKNLGGQF